MINGCFEPGCVKLPQPGSVCCPRHQHGFVVLGDAEGLRAPHDWRRAVGRIAMAASDRRARYLEAVDRRVTDAIPPDYQGPTAPITLTGHWDDTLGEYSVVPYPPLPPPHR